MSFELTNDQKKAIDIITKKYKAGDRYAVLAGYGGTGKSTCIKYLISALGLTSDEVAFATPTGKAAQVLTNMGNPNAQTIHKLLYYWKKSPEGFYTKTPKKFLDYKMVVCDEISMVSIEFAKELLTHDECFILFTGDPSQLKPVLSEDNRILDSPDMFLEEIMRQALESDIIKISMDVRHGKPLPRYEGNDIKILDNNELSVGMLEWATQVCCATNSLRKYYNQVINRIKGFPDNAIVNGQKVICLQNYWETVDTTGQEPLINGSIGFLQNVRIERKKLPPSLGEKRFEIVRADIKMESGLLFTDMVLDKQQLLTGIPTFNDREISAIKKFYNSAWAKKRGLNCPLPYSFEFGWCITVWKAQGSEWDKVLVIEEKFPYDEDSHTRYLYTAITRGREKVVLIKK